MTTGRGFSGRGWQTEHGAGTWRVWAEPVARWHWEVTFPDGGMTWRGPYATELGAERAAWNCIKRWERDAQARALRAAR